MAAGSSSGSGGGGGTIREMLLMHITPREAYERFLGIGIHPEQARNSLALLLWLDSTHQQAIRHLPGLNPDALATVASEANSIVDCLRGDRNAALELEPTPLVSALCHQSGGVDPVFLALNQDLVVRGIADIIDGVGAIIFDDHHYRLLRRYQTGLVGRLPELDEPYTSRRAEAVPEDCRSMFVTFSRGQPIERDEIFDHFRHKWGDCIVRVLMEKTTGGAPPMYGRIIFKSEAFVGLVLNGEALVKIAIGNRQIWLRKYIPRPQN